MSQNIHAESNRLISAYIARKAEEEKTFSLADIKGVLNNQLLAEKQMGADERDFQLISNIFADLEHLFEGGWIIGGVKFSGKAGE